MTFVKKSTVAIGPIPPRTPINPRIIVPLYYCNRRRQAGGWSSHVLDELHPLSGADLKISYFKNPVLAMPGTMAVRLTVNYCQLLPHSKPPGTKGSQSGHKFIGFATWCFSKTAELNAKRHPLNRSTVEKIMRKMILMAMAGYLWKKFQGRGGMAKRRYSRF